MTEHPNAEDYRNRAERAELRRRIEELEAGEGGDATAHH